MIMAVLIILSLSNQPWLAAVLFVIFSVEIGHRIALIRYRSKLYPYRIDPRRKIEILFLVLDIIGVSSLLLTVFHTSLPLEGVVLARMFRVVYLLRAVRLLRYIDLQNALYSPTYGMLISLIVIISFFSEGTVLWAILIFFSVELVFRFIVMRSMRFPTRKDKSVEWFFWWMDLFATIAMMPFFNTATFGAFLRVLRLARLLRPWSVIVRNLVAVVREGQFMQEINLIILILAVLSIGGGFLSGMMINQYDFTRDGIIDSRDQGMMAHIWFAFRAFTDPGNTVTFPDSNIIAAFSVFAVVTGVFIFAFFIGIGASIVSGLMTKLRNSELSMTNHMVMLGWNDSAPFILQQLRRLSDRTFSRLRLALLHDSEKHPDGLIHESWISFRWGDIENIRDLKRINMATAKQAIVNIPDRQPSAENIAHSFFSLLAIRSENPGIFINYATPELSTPLLDSYHHQLQVGWDNKDCYNKPTVLLSQADIKADLMKEILHYPDFDQVLSRLMIPVRHDESSLQVVDWHGFIRKEAGELVLEDADKGLRCPLKKALGILFARGVVLVAFADESLKIHPSPTAEEGLEITRIVGIALDPNTLAGEMEYVLRHGPDTPVPSAPTVKVRPSDRLTSLKIVIIGHVTALPLVLKRLLNEYDSIDLTLIDDLSDSEQKDQLDYLQRRIAELPGAAEKIHCDIRRWNFLDMEALRQTVTGANRIILSRPAHIRHKPHAIVASVLSHLFTIVSDFDEKPFIYPVVDNRDQAHTLQKELGRFEFDHEIHITVPNEFYGTYVAHTSFGMFSSSNEAIYNSQRVLRYVISDLMSAEEGKDIFDIDAVKINTPLPQDIHELFLSLLEQNYLLIGYRLKSSFERTESTYDLLFRMFPREENYDCLRQLLLVVNPNSSAVLSRVWQQRLDEVVELIVIRIN